MKQDAQQALSATEIEVREWVESLDYVIEREGPERARLLLEHLQIRASQAGIAMPLGLATPYVNTIPAEAQAPYPGNRELEDRLAAYIRWNAMAMVVRANRREEGIGGHLATFQSSAVLYEVGFNHFFRAGQDGRGGDQVYFQGHGSPGMYARAFLEGRISETQLANFRREMAEGGGLASYPHPWLMPEFWQFPTVSMGLGPLMAVYQARFNRYLAHRGLAQTADSHVWAFLGDGETDEPETLAAIRLAAREQLDNLTFVINCNLQRLDGPVRGNGKIVQELEALFHGAGWHVIKVLWSSDWDPIFARDTQGLLARRLDELVDGDLQKMAVEGGAYMREHLFNTPELRALVAHLSDDQLAALQWGGHDPVKVYAAYAAAMSRKAQPTVILAQTVKGYGLGESGEARNVAHEQKKLNEAGLLHFRDRFRLPLSDAEAVAAPFLKPAPDSPEMRYLMERRQALGGSLPRRNPKLEPLPPLAETPFVEFKAGSERPASTTMVLVRLLSNLLRDKTWGKLVVPIVPDEARTFGMEGLFRQIGIYSPLGQKYEPVDAATLMPYREAKDGQLLEEGINEAGAMASFIAAGTAAYTHGVNTIPVYLFYSMFGLQRIGDLVWAAADMRSKGFLVGGLSGRTQLAGEGLQHQDGHSHLLAYPIPNLRAYDPAFAFELAAIVKDGLRRMYVEGEDIFYYITVGNENYPQLPMPDGVSETEIVNGLYCFRPAAAKRAKLRATLLGSGAILNEALRAQEILAERYRVAADVWSVTSYKQLHGEALAVERWNLRHPGETPRVPYVAAKLASAQGPVVAASDYVKALPETIARWVPRPFLTLGTDGFGRSEARLELRRFFEVDAHHLAFAALTGLAQQGKLPWADVAKAQKELGIDPDKRNPSQA